MTERLLSLQTVLETSARDRDAIAFRRALKELDLMAIDFSELIDTGIGITLRRTRKICSDPEKPMANLLYSKWRAIVVGERRALANDPVLKHEEKGKQPIRQTSPESMSAASPQSIMSLPAMSPVNEPIVLDDDSYVNERQVADNDVIILENDSQGVQTGSQQQVTKSRASNGSITIVLDEGIEDHDIFVEDAGLGRSELLQQSQNKTERPAEAAEVPSTSATDDTAKAGPSMNPGRSRPLHNTAAGRATTASSSRPGRLAAGDASAGSISNATVASHPVEEKKDHMRRKNTIMPTGMGKVHWQKVPTLREVCLDCIGRNLTRMTELEALPTDWLLDLLRPLDSDKLAKVEARNPEIIPSIDPLWQKHVRARYGTLYVRKMDETWRDVWLRVRAMRERGRQRTVEKLQRAQRESGKDKVQVSTQPLYFKRSSTSGPSPSSNYYPDPKRRRSTTQPLLGHRRIDKALQSLTRKGKR
eukprot:Clim_evm53s150 gene=Clim_evmTU53s150